MSEIKLIKFKLNQNPLFAKKLDINETLFQIRKKLEEKLPANSIFTFRDGTIIEQEDEKSFTLQDIIEKVNNFYELHILLEEAQEENEEESLTITEKPISSSCQKSTQASKKNDEQNSEEENNENSDACLPSWLIDDSNNNIEPIPKNNSPHHMEKQKKFFGYAPNKDLNKNNKNIKSNKIENPKNVKNLNYKTPNNPDSCAAPHLINNYRKNNYVQEYTEKISKFSQKQLSQFKLIGMSGKLKIYLYPSCTFTPEEERRALSFMVVGETGCGKTTLLNSFINSLLGVEMEDDYRFKIIFEEFQRTQAMSQTSDVNYYNIRSVDGYPPVRIIDTPGFGDTRGIERDKEIKLQIKELFEKKIKNLNAVCFVTKSSNNRLSHTQKYILSSILDLFGKDVKDIFIFMLTFCDGGKPNVVEALKDKDSPFSQIIDMNQDSSWYLKFNNSAIFEGTEIDECTKSFWKIGMKSFSNFKKKLMSLPKKSLALSKTVLQQRKYLEEKVEILSKKLKVGLNKMEEINGIIKMVLNLKGDIDDSKNFTQKIMKPVTKKIPKDPNYYATTCLICTKTCHSNCRIKDDDNKKNCSAMDNNGYCVSCPKKCIWSEHKNRDFILEDVMEETTVTLEELKKRYNYSKGQLSVKKHLFISAREELINLNLELLDIQDEISESINLLHEIALNQSVFESAEQHIDLLIEVEYSEHKPGWQSRVHSLNILKEQKKMLREVYQGKNQNMIKIKKFVENEIKKYCDIDENNLDQYSGKDNCFIF